MRRLLLAAALAAPLALAACGADVNSGEVTGKRYEEAHTRYISQCLPVGKNPCGTTILTPVYESEHYVITLTNGDESEDHYVDPATYADTNVGDQLTLED